jgi:death-on-curing protein
VTLPELAAGYLFGLVRNHPYVDGNKRVGLIAAVAFLALNGCRLTAGEVETTAVVLDLAAGRVPEPELARWLTGHVSPSDPDATDPPAR